MKKSILFIVLLCSCVNAFSQQPDNDKKPKIGLVLSGGGAKGLAHIGVLKVLEEAGVEISYIGGTSMGAIVGGLYASGYNAHQIDSIFKVTDFDAVVRDFIPRASKNFYEKKNDEMYAISLPFENFKIGVPNAYSKGLNIYNMLNKLTHNVRHVRDFNKLPIPFLCIATNIETGEEVLLDKGYLSQAILASATFPSLFSPVLIDDQMLIDGGVANNYPIDEVRKLGADIIIGVDVQDDLKDRESLNNATRILIQISNLQMINKMNKKKRQTEIYIKPDIKNYTVISFDEGSEIIKKGEEAGFAVYEKLKVIGSGFNKQKKSIQKCAVDTLSIKEININELDNYTRAYVLGKLGFNAGNKITYNDLKVGIDNLNATQNFSSMGYYFEEKDGVDVFNLNLIENPTKTFLRFGLHYDDLYKSAVLINFTKKKLLFKNDVASLDVILGDNFRYNFDYYIDNGFYWSFGFKSRYNSFSRNIYTDDGEEIFGSLGLSSINVDFEDFTNQIYFQTIFKQKFIVGVGLELKNIEVTSQTFEDATIGFENNRYLNALGYIKYDSLDNFYFPTEGWYFSGDIQSYIYSSNLESDFNRFSYVRGDFGFAQSITDKFTFVLQAEGGFTVGEGTIPFLDFVLGGYGFNEINNFKHFYGYEPLSISGDSYLKSTFTLDYEIFKKNHLNFSANYANIGDNLFDSDEWYEKPRYSGYAFGYGLETIIGPIEIKHTWSPETKDHHTWFSVGFWF
ncbi:NTE family protein [Flavobacterium arsenatis]|uniref:NTE family protein n=1 Tax=Flavobacterium arsenatis TaxID=1484332 RepID=A0ABU1TS64_9FLAO|nr:patatin-like phospholipase family protein [Flavobacterium arsenatis]MDR6968682.1 NTE family protein [Flavobacterium arsenatis]